MPLQNNDMKVYYDRIKQGLKVNNKSMREIAKHCKKTPPTWMKNLFKHTKNAMGKKVPGKLVLIDNAKFKEFTNGVVSYVGSLGVCEDDNTCYVVETNDKKYEETMASLIIHETLHIVFGPHPWPNERPTLMLSKAQYTES